MTSWLRLAALCLLLWPVSAQARTIRIELDGSGDYPTIQDGIDNATAGDVVLVGPGVYTWTNQDTDARTYNNGSPAELYGMCVFWSDWRDDVTLRSVAGPEETVLDAEGRGRIFFAGGDNGEDVVEFTIEGFTARNGRAPDSNPEREEEEGGALAFHLVSPTVRNCIFRNCTAEYGGAMWLGNSGWTTIEDCEFYDNVAEIVGGAIFNHNSSRENVLTGCRFEGNRSGRFGGALAIYNDIVTVRNTVFLNNEAVEEGAALWMLYSKPATIEDCWFQGDLSPKSAIEIRWEEPPPNAPPGLSRTRVQFHRNMVYQARSRGIVLDEGSRLFSSCNNIHGSQLGNWAAEALDHRNVDGNLSVDPLLCGDSVSGVREDSPLLAVNHPDCEADIGGAELACSLPVTPPPTSATWRAAAPNPFRPQEGGTTLEYQLPSEGPATVRIYSLRGSLVRKLTGTNAQAEWDGMDAAGRSVAAGVYVVRAESGDQMAEGRVVLLK